MRETDTLPNGATCLIGKLHARREKEKGDEREILTFDRGGCIEAFWGPCGGQYTGPLWAVNFDKA
jgi:hypothetical protein